LLILYQRSRFESVDWQQFLEVSPRAALGLIYHCSNITRLRLNNMSELSNSELETIIRKSPQLADLRVRRCHRIGDPSLILLNSQHTPHLSTLDCRGCLRVSSAIIDSLCTLQQLRRLKIECILVSNEALCRLWRARGNQLQSLALNHSFFVSEECVRTLLQCLEPAPSSLRSLRLKWTTELTDRMLQSMAGTLSQLQKLSVRFCPQLTVAGLVEFANAVSSLSSVNLDALSFPHHEVRSPRLQQLLREAHRRRRAKKNISEEQLRPTPLRYWTRRGVDYSGGVLRLPENLSLRDAIVCASLLVTPVRCEIVDMTTAKTFEHDVTVSILECGIRSSRSATVLRVSSVMRDMGIMLLAPVFDRLKVLLLQKCQLGDVAVRAVVSHFECGEQLDLSYNRLSEESAPDLAHFLDRNRGLKVLNLSHNTLGDAMPALFGSGRRIDRTGGATKRSVLSMELIACGLTAVGAVSIGKALEENYDVVKSQAKTRDERGF
jgi:hypothetical protein